MDWLRKLMFWFWRKFVNLCGASLDLFGEPVSAHLLIPSPIPAHLQNLFIFSNCGWIWVMFEEMMTRSSA